jgi:hypothetical protein
MQEEQPPAPGGSENENAVSIGLVSKCVVGLEGV